MSNIRCPHNWVQDGWLWECTVCEVATSHPDWFTVGDFPDDLCGEMILCHVCRLPIGHEGWHYTGDLGEASCTWSA